MSQDAPQNPIARKQVLCTMPGTDAVIVRRDETYRMTDTGALTMDLYYPPDSRNGPLLPAVVFVLGFSDVGAKKILGCSAKEMGSYVSWARLAAASGLVAITYTNREPEADLHAVLDHVRSNAASLGIDANRIGVWACSGHVPMALSLLMQKDGLRPTCAVLCYGYMLDLDGLTGVAEAAAAWRFVNASAGKSVDDLRRDVPLFVARAGRDQFAGLNEGVDRFLANAVARNLPVTFVNHPEGPHAFDLDHDSETTREIIRGILAFMRCRLGAAPVEGGR
ncbi:MAG: hypothetical protein A3H97_06015 [Acidobacteria bacterium RIFCSPLOWO2_02_FULL_65_29]|nr:MAG: hypothetical protein A3H97_06015 [Acidobacteria bacterium RIFCSPLOWO2_02_FULL_65_29]